MNKFAPLALAATIVALGAAPAVVFAAETQAVHAVSEGAGVDVSAGKMLYGPDGNRIAKIYRVSREGNPQLIIDGKMVTVPASTLSDADGKVATSLTKREILSGN